MSNSLPALAEFLKNALGENVPIHTSEGGFIRDGFDAEVDEYRNIAHHGKEYLAKLLGDEIEKTSIASLKIKSNKVFGYFFEVPLGQAKNVPDYFIRKQTLSNAERFITPELKEYEEKVFSAQDKLITREQELFAQIQAQVLEHTAAIQSVARAIAELDLVCSFASTAQKRRFCRPRFAQERTIHIVKGRHPVVELLTEKYGQGRFVPNNLSMGKKEKVQESKIKNEETITNYELQITNEEEIQYQKRAPDSPLLTPNSFCLVTGPNMAGKSTFLRQNALILLLAHMGSFVPAEEAIVPLTDGIFTRIGSGDILSKGQSTFLVEMQETAHILRHATKNSFVILDEVGRGTSTYDGLSLAWAITEHLHHKRIPTLFATHYHELIDLTQSLPHAKNLSVAILENEHGVTFLHKIVEGGVSKSFGIEVAELAGIPAEVTKRAGEILKNLEHEELSVTTGETGQRRKIAHSNPQTPNAQMYDPNQQDLFAPAIQQKQEPSAVEKELQALNLHEMTPLQAMLKLVELQAKTLK